MNNINEVIVDSDNQNTYEFIDYHKFIVENATECIWLFDLKKDSFKYISPSVAHSRGLTVEEAMKEKLEDCFTPESLKRFRRIVEEQFQKYLDEGSSEEVIAWVDEFQQHCKDGIIKCVEISIKLIYDEKTNSIYVLGVSRDITERKKLELNLIHEIDDKNQLIKNLRESEQKLSRLIKDLSERNKILKEIADTDELTGLYNRYFLDEKIVEEIEKADKDNTPLSLIIFDLDHFKRVNDTWGHDVGDVVLIRTADMARRIIGSSEILARWGGEEFVILMPQTSLDGALVAAEKLRQTISDSTHPSVGTVTASVGIAERIKLESFESWFRRVDQALYRAKCLGRNCVVSCDNSEMMLFSLVRLQWDDRLCSGNSTIDKQHKELLEIATSLVALALSMTDYTRIKDRLDDLLNHLMEHFAYEEQVQISVGFPGVKEHNQLHRNIINKAFQLKESFLLGKVKISTLFLFLVDEGIMEHLTTEDVLFFPYIRDSDQLY